jgi:hypothetical protein
MKKMDKDYLYLMGNHLRHCLVEFLASLLLDGAEPVRSTEVGVSLAMPRLLPRPVARVRIGLRPRSGHLARQKNKHGFTTVMGYDVMS